MIPPGRTPRPQPARASARESASAGLAAILLPAVLLGSACQGLLLAPSATLSFTRGHAASQLALPSVVDSLLVGKVQAASKLPGAVPESAVVPGGAAAGAAESGESAAAPGAAAGTAESAEDSAAAPGAAAGAAESAEDSAAAPGAAAGAAESAEDSAAAPGAAAGTAESAEDSAAAPGGGAAAGATESGDSAAAPGGAAGAAESGDSAASAESGAGEALRVASPAFLEHLGRAFVGQLQNGQRFTVLEVLPQSQPPSNLAVIDVRVEHLAHYETPLAQQARQYTLELAASLYLRQGSAATGQGSAAAGQGSAAAGPSFAALRPLRTVRATRRHYLAQGAPLPPQQQELEALAQEWARQAALLLNPPPQEEHPVFLAETEYGDALGAPYTQVLQRAVRQARSQYYTRAEWNWLGLLFGPGAQAAEAQGAQRYRISARTLNRLAQEHGQTHLAARLASMVDAPPRPLEAFQEALRRTLGGPPGEAQVAELSLHAEDLPRMVHSLAHYNLGLLHLLYLRVDLAAYHLAQAYAHNPSLLYVRRWGALQQRRGLLPPGLPEKEAIRHSSALAQPFYGPYLSPQTHRRASQIRKARRRAELQAANQRILRQLKRSSGILPAAAPP